MSVRPDLLDPIAAADSLSRECGGARVTIVSYSRTLANRYGFFDPGRARFVVHRPDSYSASGAADAAPTDAHGAT